LLDQARGGGFPAFAAALFGAARAEGIPVFILGAGANILVSDRGIRGIVLDTTAWTGETELQTGDIPAEFPNRALMAFRGGTSADAAAEAAAARGLGGLEFLAGMPGSIGGAVWMNARAYGREIADALSYVEVLDFSAVGIVNRFDIGIAGSAAEIRRLVIPADKAEFGYKRSPFQKSDRFILSAGFSLYARNEREIRLEMEERRRDREDKGHYRFPSAGSAFKNNRDFGKTTGKIIDELGLKGQRIGSAQIAPYHGNIIINTGGACAADIRALMEQTAAKVKEAAGFDLEPEILFAGDW
jgi:UDP-N-acetylmuramate dehydrogenase